jgi:MoaA/NifB/PqqE/SkfB family radical SAM enzyme
MVADYFTDPRVDMTMEKFKIIAKNLHMGKKVGQVVLSGAGEPLLNHDTIPIIRWLNSEYPLVAVNLITNGITLGECVKDVSLLRLNYLNVSLNASSPEVYWRTMGVNQFNRVVCNIEEYQRMGNKNLRLSYVVHYGNLRDLPGYVQLASELCVKQIHVRYAVFYSESMRRKMAWSNGYLGTGYSLYYHQEESDEYVRQAVSLADKLGVKLWCDVFPFCGLPENRECCFPFTDILVGLNGEVFPCCGGESIFKDKVASGIYNFGNALTQKLEHFHNNELWKAVRYSAKHPEQASIPECKVCIFEILRNVRKKHSHILDWSSL